MDRVPMFFPNIAKVAAMVLAGKTGQRLGKGSLP